MTITLYPPHVCNALSYPTYREAGELEFRSPMDEDFLGWTLRFKCNGKTIITNLPYVISE